MKLTQLILVFICAVVAISANPLQGNAADDDGGATTVNVNDRLREKLEEIRNSMVTGVGESGRIMEPLWIDEPPIDLAMSTIMTLAGPVTSTIAHGLSRFQVTAIDYDAGLNRINFNINIPDTVAQGFYDLSGSLVDLIPIFGRGLFRVAPFDLRFTGYIDLTTDNTGHLLTRNLYVRVSARRFEARFEGLLGGGDLGDLINVVVQDLAVTILNRYHPAISETLAESLVPILDGILNNYTLDDLLN